MVKVIKKTTKGDVVYAVLQTVKVSGLIATAVLAPNAIGVLKKLGIVETKNFKKQSIHNARYRLIKNDLLSIDSKGFVRLTDKGREKLNSYELANYELVIPRIWDGKWRVLIFDIPEYRRGLRQKIRNTLRSIGFHRIQDSVWVFPYDCAELVSLLKADFKVGKDLLYMVVDSIENDGNLKKLFKLAN